MGSQVLVPFWVSSLDPRVTIVALILEANQLSATPRGSDKTSRDRKVPALTASKQLAKIDRSLLGAVPANALGVGIIGLVVCRRSG